MLDPKDYTAAHVARSHAVDLTPLASALARHGHALSGKPHTDMWWQLVEAAPVAAMGVALIPKPDDAPEGGFVGVEAIAGSMAKLMPEDRLLGICAQAAIHIWWKGFFGRYMIAYVGEAPGELAVAVSATKGRAVANFAWRGDSILAVVVLTSDDELRAELMAGAEQLEAPSEVQ